MCPNAGALANFTRTAPQLRPVSTPVEPQGILEWAASKLDFTPSPKQAEILTSEAKYLILCCNRQWGKTTTIAAKALYAALQTPKLKIAVVARSKEQAGILIDNATEFAITLGLRTRRVPGKQQSLQLPNLSRIVAVPHTLHSSLGRTAHILIVDEAAKVTDEVYYAVSPFVSRTNGKIWLLSTPTRQTGFFYNFWHDTESNWHRVFSNVEDCPGIDRDYLAMQQRANPIRYSQDFLCQFVQPANRLCSREAATAIVRKKGDNTPSGAGIMSYVRGATVIPESKVYYGLDLGQRFDHSAFVAVELAWRHRGKDPVHFSERYQPELKITALTRFPVGLDYGKVHQMVLAALPSAPRKARLVIDAGGPGPPVVDRLRSALPAHIELKPVIITGGKGHNTLTGGYTGIPRRSLISTLLMAMVAGTLIVEEGLPNWGQLVDELVELSAETTHPIGGAMHDDLVMALALAVSAAVRDTPSLLPNHPGEPDKRTHPRLL
ncbi:MAG: terminase family protein [Bryobacterales bacterium]|nr:terminase family protein [Bryobacterales bacterium]